jgi:hypothetical protein
MFMSISRTAQAVLSNSRLAKRRRRCGREPKAAEQRRPPKLFGKLFQIQAVFVQAFPNKALAVLWDFKGLQASKT